MRKTSIGALTAGIVLLVVAVSLVGALLSGWEPVEAQPEPKPSCEVILFGEC